VGWTIFAVVDLFIGLLLIELMTTTAPPEKLPRVRTARNVTLGLLAVSVMVLMVEIIHGHVSH